jgi:Uncharacterized protein conserved in bacteria C-term(DUF2220)
MEMLNDLAQQGKVRLPKGKQGWDSSACPAVPKWLEVFRPREPDARPKMDEIAWPPELRFSASLESRTHQETLLKIREWLAAGGRKLNPVPLKERSADIFGDEKRIDKLMKTDLFAPGALTLETLRCFAVYPDLIWEKGRADASSILLIENSNTYHSFCSWNERSKRYAACVYGNGFMIHHTCPELKKVLKETNPNATIEYFGDLDVAGIRIPIHLSSLLQKAGLPAATPAETWYEVLVAQFKKSRGKLKKAYPGIWSTKDLAWFSLPLRQEVEKAFQLGYRLPQEFVGTECLSANDRGQSD